MEYHYPQLKRKFMSFTHNIIIANVNLRMMLGNNTWTIFEKDYITSNRNKFVENHTVREQTTGKKKKRRQRMHANLSHQLHCCMPFISPGLLSLKNPSITIKLCLSPVRINCTRWEGLYIYRSFLEYIETTWSNLAHTEEDYCLLIDP